MGEPEAERVAAIAGRLPELVERLRAARYDVGPREVLTVHRLLARMAAAGDWPEEPGRLRRTLAPVLCGTAREQEAFRGHFESWIAEQAPAASPEPAPVAAGSPVAVRSPAKAVAEVPARAAPWWLAAAVVAAIALVPALLWSFSQSVTIEKTSEFLEKSNPPSAVTGVPDPPPDPVKPQLDWLTALAVALCFVSLGLAWQYGGLLPAWLTGRRSSEPPELERLPVGDSSGRRPGDGWLGLHELCERDLLPDPRLDADATVRATIEQGYFTPVYGHRRELPEYLALVDKISPDDHLARFAEELMRRLEEHGLATRTLFFTRDPLSVGDPERGYATLETLASRVRDRRLLIFSDAESWLDPFDGRPRQGLEALARWSRRILLTPVPFREWGNREKLIGAELLPVIPLSEVGLSVLAELFTAEDLSPAHASELDMAVREDAAAPGRYPEQLREWPVRWLDPEEPPEEEVRELLDALRRHLGADGFRWLQSCARFPVVSWPVTCFLGHQAAGGAGRSLFEEQRLLAMSRLPWLRHGEMPDWLRLALIGDLDGEERRHVRDSLEQLLARAAPESARGSGLEIARATAWWRRGRRYLAGQSAHSPLRDYLFLSLLRGRKPVWLSAPWRVRALFRDYDRWSAMAAVLLALGATFAAAVRFGLEAASSGRPPGIDVGASPDVYVVTATPTFPEFRILIVCVLLSLVIVPLHRRRFRARPPDLAPAAADPPVPGLIQRTTFQRLPVLFPLAATSGVAGFIGADVWLARLQAAGELVAGTEPPGIRWIATGLAALLILAVYFLFEWRWSRADGARPGQSEELVEAAP